MKAIMVLVVAAGATLCSPAQAQSPDFSAFDREVKAQCASGDFGGLITIAVAGEPVYSHACGDEFAPGARFKIFSTSKLLTALAVMKLVEDGRMALDAPIADYIPDLPKNWRGVTVRHLLNHTSGLGDHTNELVDHFGPDHRRAMRGLLKQRDVIDTTPSRPPGTHWRYNNFGYELLADAAARIAGESFDRVLARLVFTPAGMTDALAETGGRRRNGLVSDPDPRLVPGWNRDGDGPREEAISYSFVQLGAGAVHASMDDMIALDRAIAGNQVVRQKTWATMIGSPVAMSPANPGAYYGLGVMVSERGGLASHGHNGGTNGYISTFRRFPAQDAVVIALSNIGWTGTRWIEEAAATALAADQAR